MDAKLLGSELTGFDSERPLNAPSPETARAPQAAPTETPGTPSPWWTAPGGRPVDIPAFGSTSYRMGMHIIRRNWLEKLWDLLMPKPIGKPVPAPVKVRAR